MTKEERKNHLMNIKQNGSLTNEEREAIRLSVEDLEKESFMNKPCVAHQVCHEDKVKVLDKIKADIEQKARPNELGGRGNGKSIRYGLCMALDIIDKYRIESEDKIK